MWGDNSSTVGGYLQYCGGIPSVLWRLFGTVGGYISTVGDNISTVGDNISTVGDNISTVGDNISTVGDTFSTVEVVQYSGQRFEILRIFKESRNLFLSLFRFEIRSTTSQDSIVDHG